MKLLLTGSFGNLGLMCLRQALDSGHEVRCFDIDSPRTRERAGQYRDHAEVVLGSICDDAILPQLVAGVDAILHNAAVLPPLTETQPEMAYAINVRACKALMAEAQKQQQPPVFVFPSSVTVFGLRQGGRSLRTVHDDVYATDNYTRHKIEIENSLRSSSLPWVILRIGVSVDARTLGTDLATFKGLLAVKADNPLEYVHPKDVAVAMCRAADHPGARNRILLIGGGTGCQITQREFLNAAFNAAGLELPVAAHGDSGFYTHWMDTAESQRILEYQRHDFAAYAREMSDRLRYVRNVLTPVRGLANPLVGLLLRRLRAA